MQKFFRFLKLLMVLSDRVLIRFHSDRALLRFFGDGVLFESSVIYSSSWSSVIDSSLGSSGLFFRHAAVFLIKTCYYFFLLKTDVLFYIAFSKRSSYLTISLTCFNTFNKTDIEKHEEILTCQRHKILHWNYMSSTSRFINYLYCWIYSKYILQKKIKLIPE